MKVGFSFGRCVRDLVKGVVKYEEVLLIYAATHVTKEHLPNMIQQYSYQSDYLNGLDYDECLAMATRLLENAKVFQPREHGKSPLRIREAGVWMDLAPTVTGDTQQSPLVQKAWREYQMALKLSNPEALPADQFKPRTEQEQAELDHALNTLAGSI
jgi:hypothetical protein